MKELNKKLFELRKAVKGFVPDKTNPHFKSKFFNINQMIEDIQPEAEKLGLLIQQPIEWVDNKNVMLCMVIDWENEQEKCLGRMALPDLPDPQKMGSALTYYRRQMLKSAFFWGDVDDDGNDASEATRVQATKAPQGRCTKEQVDMLEDYIVRLSVDEAKLLETYKVKKLTGLTYEQAEQAIGILRDRENS